MLISDIVDVVKDVRDLRDASNQIEPAQTPDRRKEQKPSNIDIASVECMFTKLFSKILIPNRLNMARELFSCRTTISLRYMN